MNDISKICQCNNLVLIPSAKPLFRFICHCTTCQRYSGKPYNDECFFRYSAVNEVSHSNVSFKNYQSSISPLQRGSCENCGKPVFSVASLASLLKFALIPTESISKETLPLPLAHVFYHRRESDINDQVAKCSGYWKSQLIIQKAILKSCFFSENKA